MLVKEKLGQRPNKTQYVIGLTGGIASGKSTVSGILCAKGIRVLDADAIGHELMKSGRTAYQEICDTFGKGFLMENGEIDRKKLGAYVFSEPSALKKLNAILHPRIASQIAGEVRQAKGICVIDAALLTEVGLDALCDAVWAVRVPRELQVKRLMGRNHLSREDALRRMESQLSDAEREKFVTDWIDNSGTAQQLEKQVGELLKKAVKAWEESRKLR